MKLKQTSANPLPALHHVSGVRMPERPDWRPVHPFLRFVSAVLSVVLGLTFGGPVQQAWGQVVLSSGTVTTSGTVYISEDNTTVLLNSGSGTVSVYRADATSKYVSSGTLMANSNGSTFLLRVEPHEALVSLPPIVTLTSGSLTPTLAGLSFADPVYSVLNNSTLTNRFAEASVFVNTSNVSKLSLGNFGLTVQNGLQLSFSADPAATAPTGTFQNVALVGTGTSQTWTIGDIYTTTPSFVAGAFDYENSTAVRVEYSQATPVRKKLKIDTKTNVSTGQTGASGGMNLSSAWLDVGPNIDLEKKGVNGNLYLQRVDPTKNPFSGTLDVAGGGVIVGPGFLQVSGGTSASVSFTPEGDTAFPVLRIDGVNSVATIKENITSYNPDTDVTTTIATPTIEAIGESGFSGEGTLVLELGATNLSLASLVRDYNTFDSNASSARLAVIKRGTGTFAPKNNDNSFSGGLTLEAGTLEIGVGGVDVGSGLFSGVAGIGALVLAPRTTGVTLRFGSAEVHAGTLYNDKVVLSGTSNLANSSKATVEGFSPGDTLSLVGPLMVEAEGGLATNFELSLLTPLVLFADLSVIGTLTITGGQSLTIAHDVSNDLGNLVLQNGTFRVGASAGGLAKPIAGTIAIKGTTGNRRITLGGTDAVLVPNVTAAAPVWESTLNFSGGSNTLEIQAATAGGAAIAVGGSAALIVEDGTLALGGIQRAAGATAAALSKSGAGTLEFRGNLVSTGSVALTSLELLGGPVAFTAASPIAFDAPVKLSGSTLSIATGGSLTISLAVTGTGFTKAGAGALSLTNTTAFTGAATLRSGPLSLAAASGAISLGDAQTAVSDAPTLFSTGSVSGAINVGAGATSAYTATLASSGTTGIATFSGPITFSAGSAGLVLQAATGGTLDFTGAWTTNNKPVTVGASGKAGTVKLSGTLSSTGGISVVSGSLQTGASNALSATTPITLNGGSLTVGALNATAGSVTLTSGNIYGAGSLNAANVIAQSGSIFANLTGSGSFTKDTAGSVTVLGKSLYSGATTVSAGTLTAGLPSTNSAVSIASGATYRLTLTESGTYKGQLTNNGTTLLTSATPVVLTLDTAARLSGSLQIGSNVTLMPAAGAQDGIFATGFTLTLNGGSYSANGTTQTISNIAFLTTGGSLLGTGTIKTNTVPAASASNIFISNALTFPISRKTNQIDGGALVNPLEFYAGALGELASGGTYAQIVVASDTSGAVLSFDRLVTASTSVSARLSAGSASSTGYTLSVGSLVVTPLFDIQKGVTALFATGGSFSGATLNIGGTVNLSATTKGFATIQLNDGNLINGTLAAGTLVDQGTASSSLSATLGSGFGNLTKTGSGILTISGTNTAYVGSVTVSGGTVVLGGTAALGTLARVASLDNGTTLRLAGNSIKVAAIAGSGTIENASSQSATLTLETTADSIFGGVLRDGNGSGSLSLVKSGANTVTLTAASLYNGSTTLKQGLLELSGSGALPAATALTIEAGTFALGGKTQAVSAFTQSGGRLENGGVLLNTGSFLLSGGTVGAVLSGSAAASLTGNVTLSAAATYAGATFLNSGRLEIAAGGALPSSTALNLLGGTFALGSSTQTVGAYAQRGGVVENGSVLLNSGSFALSGGSVSAVLGGSAGVWVTGDITISRVATYTGPTFLNSGKLQLTSAGALSAQTAVTVQAGTLSLGGNNQTVASFTQNSGLVEAGTLTQQSGSFALNGGSVNATLAGSAGATVAGNVTLNQAATYTGATVLNSGKLQLAGAGALSTQTALTIQGGTLSLGGKNQTVLSFTQTSGSVESGGVTLQTGNFALNGGSVNATLAGTAGAEVGGNVTFNSAATYTGATSLNSGKLQLASSGLLPSSTALTVHGGTLDLGGKAQNVGAVVVNGGRIDAGTLSGSAYTFNGGTMSASLAGPATASVTGAVTLSGANTYTGATSLGSSAQLTVGATNALAGSVLQYNDGTVLFGSAVNAATFGGLTGTKDLALTKVGGGSVALTVANATNATYGGVLTGEGSFTKAGSGNLTLTQTPTYAGATTVSAGSLTLGTADLLKNSPSINNDGTINLTLSAGLIYSGTLGGSGTVNLTSSTPVTLTLASTARLGGTIVLNNVKLDLSAANELLASGTTLKIGSGASVQLGTTTQEIATLVFNGGTLGGSAGAKVLYSSLVPGNLLNDAGTNPKDATYADTAIAFEVLSKTAPIPSTGTQTGLLVTAGRAGAAANGLQLLLLQPESTTTRVIIDKPLVLSTGIVATTGTVNGVSLAKGMVSIENILTLTTGSIRFGAGIEATLTQNGSLNASALDNSGLLIVDVSGSKAVGIPIRGSGSVRKAGNGTATFTGSNSYTGSTTLAGGVLEIGTASALGTSGNIEFAGGTLRHGAGVTNDLSARIAAITSGTTAGIDTGGNTVIYATGLSGSGGIAKLGAGTLVLTGTNTFSGATSVKTGTLQVGTGGTTGSLAAAAVVAEGASLRFLRSNNVTYSGALSGGGTVEQAGAGGLTLDGSNAGFEGTLVLSSGSLGLGSASASGTAVISFNGGTLRYESGVATDVSSRIAALASGRSANIDTGGNLVSFAAGLTGAGALNKLGAGTLELLTNSTYSGTTTVTAGLLRAGTALASTGAIRVSGGTLEVSSYNPSAVLSIDAKGAAIVPVDGGEFQFGTIVNQGRLAFTGVLNSVEITNLSGSGESSFAADATLLGGISSGSISVAGDLVTPTVSGGTVSAATLYNIINGGTAGVDVSGGHLLVDGQIRSELKTVSGGSLVFLGPVRVSTLAGGSLDAREAALGLVSGGTARLSGFNVTIGTVSGGALYLDANTPSINVLNGGNIVNQAVLTVSSGSTSGSISGNGSLTKIGPSDLSLSGPTSYIGATRVMEGTLFVGGLATLAASDELFVDEEAQARFTAASGTITLKALTGNGRSTFASNAVILGGAVATGTVEAAGRLTANVSGGSVTAAALTAGTVSGGAISLTDGVSNVTRLTNGSINLATAASLAVGTGTFSGSLTGSGTLIKTGAATLELTATPPVTVSVNVQGGTLNVEALLTGTRSVSVASGAILNTTTSTGIFSGRLTGAGTTSLTGPGTPTILTLGSTGFLQGGLNLGDGLTLDISQNTNSNVVDPATSLTLVGSSQLSLGSRQVELQDLVLSQNARLVSDGAVILYDSTPLVRFADNSTAPIIDQSNAIVAGTLISGSLRFEENSKKGNIFSNGNYQFIAGRVKDLPTNTEVKRLLLDPIAGKTVRISSAIPNVTQEIVATGTGAFGFVSVGTAVAAPQFVIGSDIQATFTDAGALAANGVFVNNGTLRFSVLAGNKTVANRISGSGVLEKIDAGTLVLSGANSYTGATRLSAGFLQLDSSAALGTGTIVFNGGGLKYGAGIADDLSRRFAAIGNGVSAVVDTGTSNVTFASVLSGAGGVAKSGNGTLVLAAANTFSGALDVLAGTVKVGIGSTGSLNASSANVTNGALLSFERTDATTFAGNVTGPGRVAQAGAGALTLTGDGSGFTGTYELRSGTTVLGGPKALAGGSLSFGGGTLRYGTGTFEDLSDQFASLSTTAMVDTGAYDVTYQAGLTGTAGFTKYGVGALIFAGANNYAGITTVAAGTLRYTGAGLASGGTIQTLANTVVQLQHDGAETPFNGLVSGLARLQKTGAGSITISGTQTNTGGVTLDAGSLILKNNATLGGIVTLNTGSTLDILAGSLNPNATLTFGGGKLRIGDSELIVNSLNLGAGEILFAGTAESTTLYYTQQTGSALVTGTSLTSGVIVPEQVTLLKYAKNADGSAAALSGALKGTITKLPATSDLNVTPSGKRLTFAVEGGLNLTSFTGENGVDLAITKPVNLTGDFKLKGGTLLLGGTLKSTGGNVTLGAVTGGSSTAVTGTIGSGGSIVARELTLTGKSALRLENLDGVKGVQTLQVGALSTGASDSVRKDDATLDLAGGTLVLAPGQTLKGSGSIVGNLSLGENSILSPGNSPGTLYLAGSLNLTSGTVRIEVGGLSGGLLIQDRVSVTGGSVVIGGTAGERPTFQIVDTDGILSSGGTLGSLFVDGNGASLSPTILNQGTFTFARQSSSGTVLPSVMYVLQTSGAVGGPMTPQIQRLRFASFAGSAPNIAGFATALDTRILTQQAATDGLLELGTGITSTNELPAQLAAAMPVVYAEMAALSTQRTLNIHQGLVGHFSSLRANLRETPEGVFNAWTTGYGASNKQDGSRALGTAGFSASTWGDLFGVEQRIGGFLLGVTGAAGRTSANFAQNPGSATTDSWHGGLYGVVDLESVLVESGVLYGATDTRVRRTIAAPGLTTREGRTTLNGAEWVANFGLSKPIAATSTLTLVPSLRVIAQGQSQSAAKESDLSGLEVAIAKQNATTFLHQAGVELRKKLSVSGRPAAASLQLDWIHNYSARGRTVDMALSGNQGASFGYRGSDSGADAFQVGAAFEAALTERTVLRLGGEYQSQTGLSTVRGSVSLGYQF